MSEHSSSLQIQPTESRRRHWLAALLFGLLLLVTLLLASWFLRACAPVDFDTKVTTLESPAPPAPEPPPDPTPVLKASLEGAQADEKDLKAELAAVTTELKRKVAQCRAVEVKPPEPKPVEAKPAPPPPPPQVAKAVPPPPLPADRWAHKDLGMLQGCWRLGHDTQGTIGSNGRSEMCAIKAGRICFESNGGGQRQTTADCPRQGIIRCAAPITARFGNDNTLGTTQPAVRCSAVGTSWNGPPNSLSCRRVSDTLAICRDRLNFEHEFRRE